MREQATTTHYLGPLGQRLRPSLLFGLKGRISDRNIQQLGRRYRISRVEGKSQAIMNVTQIKDAILYMSQSDKIGIYRWLDRELAGDLPSRIGSRRSTKIRQEIERRWKANRSSEQPYR